MRGQCDDRVLRLTADVVTMGDLDVRRLLNEISASMAEGLCKLWVGDAKAQCTGGYHGCQPSVALGNTRMLCPAGSTKVKLQESGRPP